MAKDKPHKGGWSLPPKSLIAVHDDAGDVFPGLPFEDPKAPNGFRALVFVPTDSAVYDTRGRILGGIQAIVNVPIRYLDTAADKGWFTTLEAGPGSKDAAFHDDDDGIDAPEPADVPGNIAPGEADDRPADVDPPDPEFNAGGSGEAA